MIVIPGLLLCEKPSYLELYNKTYEIMKYIVYNVIRILLLQAILNYLYECMMYLTI